MLAVFLFLLALILSTGHLLYQKRSVNSIEIFLSYILFFNMGVMGILATYAHIFMADETARLIGWQPGSPFQFEVAMANLSFGVLGLLSFWRRGRFWDAAILGWSVLLLGCFVGHIIDYVQHNNTAPFNIGTYVWFNDLFLPILTLILLYLYHRQIKSHQ